MSLAPQASRPAALDVGAVLARWIVGGFFVYLGLNKALQPVIFLKQVHEYQMVSNPVLLNSIAGALPWFEVFCGALLVVGVAVRGSALLLIGMLVPFTAAVFHRALALAAGQGISFWFVKFDCGCGTGEVVFWHKLVENSVLILLSAWLLRGRGRWLCLRYGLLPEPRTSSATAQPGAQAQATREASVR